MAASPVNVPVGYGYRLTHPTFKKLFAKPPYLEVWPIIFKIIISGVVSCLLLS